MNIIMVHHALFIVSQGVTDMGTIIVTPMEIEFVCQDGVGLTAIFVSGLQADVMYCKTFSMLLQIYFVPYRTFVESSLVSF